MSADDARNQLIEVLALAMQHHLPVAFDDGKVMCCCADLDAHPDASILFDGPVYHRRHVGTRALDALLARRDLILEALGGTRYGPFEAMGIGDSWRFPLDSTETE